jgi:hypothetical protein
MRHEWTDSEGQQQFVELTGPGSLYTTSDWHGWETMQEFFRLAERVRELEEERASLADFLNIWAREQAVRQVENLEDGRDLLKRLADRIWGELNIRIAELEEENRRLREAQARRDRLDNPLAKLGPSWP